LPIGSTALLAREWSIRVRRTVPSTCAEELYQGRAFLEALKVSETTKSPLYVVSAGLGLLRADKKIPSYSLTVSPGTADAIQNRCTDTGFSAADWWTKLTARLGLQYPLAHLIGGSKSRLWLLALPRNYYELVIDDLGQLSDRQLERVRIVGPQLDKSEHRVLDACLLSIDDRLNGPDSPLPGTQTDFAQRAARFTYDTVIRGNLEGGVTAHRRAISRRLSAMRPATRHKRQSLSDEAIMRKIEKLWRVADGKSGRMLRVLRDKEQIACEQGRFNGLFKSVRKSLNL